MKVVFFLGLLLIPVVVFSEIQIPTLTPFVNDFANVITLQDEMRIQNLCEEIEHNTTVEIAILIVKTTQPLSIEEFAAKTFEKNGIGKKDKDNGILIVVAVDDRKWKLEIGYGMEPIINDAKAGRIGRAYLTTYFKEGDYADGLYYAVDAVNKIIQNSGDDSFISEQTSNTEGDVFTIVILILFASFALLPLIIIFSGLIFAERCPNCGARMKCHYDKDGYLVCECPKCGKKTKKKKRSNFWFFIGGFHGGGGFGGGGGGGFGGGGSGGGGAGGSW